MASYDDPPFSLKHHTWERCDRCGGWMPSGSSDQCTDCQAGCFHTLHLTGNDHPTTPRSDVDYHGDYPEDEDVYALLRDWWLNGDFDVDEMWRRHDAWFGAAEWDGKGEE